MVHVSLRVPKRVVEAYDLTQNRSKLMRQALEKFISFLDTVKSDE